MTRGTPRPATPKRDSRFRTRISRWVSAIAAMTIVLVGVTVPAHAQTVYEIVGNWAPSTPSTLQTGDTAVAVWRFNINDDAPAPTNDPVPNVTVTFTVANGIFTVLPAICLTNSDLVDPVSSISPDGTTMICNIGERDQGTAELVLAGIQITGSTGDRVSVSGEIGGQSDSTPELPIENVFAMDFKWDGGSTGSSQAGANQTIGFPWSLRHAPGAEAGPSSVSVLIDITRSNNENVIVRSAANGGPCGPITNRQSGHPYSGTYGDGATDTAPTATCEFVRESATLFRLTLDGLDYSKALVPTKDSNGVALPTDWDVIASGMIYFQFPYSSAGTFTVDAHTPTFTAPGSGATFVDLADNNQNASSYTRGTRTGGWGLAQMVPTPQGAIWTDTWRLMRGQSALALAAIEATTSAADPSQMCVVLDTRYVELDWAGVGAMVEGALVPYDGTQPTIQYFIGNGVGGVLDPTNANYNPNGWECDSTLGNSNWLSSPPEDLSTVRAVYVSLPAGLIPSTPTTRLNVMTRLKDDVPIGQDVYTWASFKHPGATANRQCPGSTTRSGGVGRVNGNLWCHPHRSAITSDAPDFGVLLTDSRYPYTGVGRDVLRVVQARPVIDKAVENPETIPGATVNYTVNYRAIAPAEGVVVEEFRVVDLLPEGATYVDGSATIAPTTVAEVGGRTELTWVLLDEVITNTDYSITYALMVPMDAAPGQWFTNDVAAWINEQRADDSARVRIREGGFVFISKTAHEALVPHATGVADDGWTIRLTSQDTVAQQWTDTIDILPYNGDGRGTEFAGTYKLSGPVDVTEMPDATVYYTDADPTTLSDDPRDSTNGAEPGDPDGNTVGWTTGFLENATAIRVIGGPLPASAQQSFTINITTTGAEHEDVYVNRAQSIASRTGLLVRTSDRFEIAAVNSVAIKKYVQDADGDWHDAQNIDDYPGFAQGASLTYRLVVTNTGDQPLEDVTITDDKVDLAGLDPLPAGLGAGAVIAELLPGEANAVTIEYTVPLEGVAVGEALVNTACAVPSDTEVDPSCDPAGIIVLPSTLAWTKIAAGTTEPVPLSGSEWTLTPVDEEGEPIGAVIIVVDCVASDVSDCETAIDADHRAGEFRVLGLEAGRYALVETKAPAGYVLDPTPHYVDVAGDTVLAEAIENEPHDPLIVPLTGGQSAQLFAVGAVTLAALTGVLLVVRHRRKTRAVGTSTAVG